jgi:sulfoxide reductase heme-binding subunit YedZ
VNGIDHTWWYLSRAAGLAAYVLLSASVVLGLTMTGGVLEQALRRYRVYDLHRFLSLLALAMTGLHVLIVLPDGYVGYSPAQLLLPFASPYRAGYVALGVFAFYGAIVVVAAFYLRRIVPYRAWRLLHYATFVVFTLALLHGVGAGTDTQADWARYLYTFSGLLVFNLAVYRALRGHARGIPAAQEGHPGGRTADGPI